MKMFDLTGRIALVTGASRGIGNTIARGLAEAGATVVLNARDAGAVKAAAAALTDTGLHVAAHAADVTDTAEVDAMFGAIERAHGPLDIVVNNAGMQHRAPVTEFSDADFDRLMAVNLRAPFLVSRAAARPMVERGRGKIVNIASVQSRLGRAGITPYAATKGGIAMLTRGLCAELAPHGIQVNALAPGYFATELTKALVGDSAFSAWLAARTPAGRWGRVDELIGAAVFLASDASSFVNGQVLYVDGGMTAVV